MIAWSASRLTDFELCPQKLYRTKILKDVEEPKGDALVWGNDVHAAIEKRIMEGTPLPPTMKQWESVIHGLLAKTSAMEIQAEQELCLASDWTPTGWWDDNAWLRGKLDFIARHEDRALVVDHKTGRRKDDMDWTQMDVFALMTFQHYPEINRVVAGYCWLKVGGYIDHKAYDRNDVPAIQQEMAGRYQPLNEANETGEWPAKQNFLCRNWCPVTDCVHNGKRK